jgi:hypothetical protein
MLRFKHENVCDFYVFGIDGNWESFSIFFNFAEFAIRFQTFKYSIFRLEVSCFNDSSLPHFLNLQNFPDVSENF